MKDAEKAMDAVLRGLREIDAPMGMERRVLEGARRRAERRRHRAPLAWGLALAAVIVATLMVPMLGRVRPIAVAPARSDAAGGRVATAASVKPDPVVTAVEERPRRKKVGRQESSEGDREAVRAMLAPSRPAPPLPLTDQEKMLLRVVHSRDPVQMAMLNPEVRSREGEAGKAEFQRFFAGTE